MNDAIHGHGICFVPIEDRVRKATDQGATKVVKYDLLQERLTQDARHYGVHALQKLFAEAGLLFLVPVACFLQIGLSFRRDDELNVDERLAPAV